MCPELNLAAELPVTFDDVMIAWDHTAPAARAVADALPILQSASSVRDHYGDRRQNTGATGIRGLRWQAISQNTESRLNLRR